MPHAQMVGRDVLGAPHPRERTWDTIGDAQGTRAAEDVGPDHAHALSAPKW